MLARLFILIPLMGMLVLSEIAQAEESSGLFPLGRSWAGDRDLPRPLGMALTFYHQSQDYHLRSLRVNLPGVGLAEASAVKVGNEIGELHVKADLWLLPFLNIFGLVGRVDGETTASVGPPLPDIKVEYEGLVYGGGLTLAAGGKRFFGSVNATFTGTELDTSKSSVKAWIVNPRVGIRVAETAFWVGGMYQEAQEHHRGHISLPVYGAVDYEVELEQEEPWNYQAGLSRRIGKHWELELEGGFGARKHAMLSVGYRF